MTSKNIVLIGFMGTGKTSVGKILAKRLNRPVVDVDLYIEENEKKKIHEIFEKEGESRFRALEKEAIQKICKRQGVVITTGGGAVIDQENFEALKASGCVIGLLAKPQTIFNRVKNSRHRPLLTGRDRLKEIEKLLAERKPFYERADFYFDTDGRTASQVADLILKTLPAKR